MLKKQSKHKKVSFFINGVPHPQHNRGKSKLMKSSQKSSTTLDIYHIFIISKIAEKEKEYNALIIIWYYEKDSALQTVIVYIERKKADGYQPFSSYILLLVISLLLQ